MLLTLRDGTRLRIGELLIDEDELHQIDIARRLRASQGRDSEHLASLTWCDFVATRREGRKTLYRVADKRMRSLISAAHDFLGSNEAAIAGYRRVGR
ncbi:MAG: metalloregulator ArsR/SmtB family transcription factor [Actinomycetota bacterium]|jgi:DNA-binding transcriptional ArsR family regulator|nr:metalloregulator ArsR/SmtB family transcription factor [Actinomycetota bacterium]